MPLPSCPGPVSRRHFLRAGILALGGLTLPELIRARAASGQGHPETSVILFWMWGGPSHLETYDLKPEAPSEYRGPFRPIRTDVPGLDVCELFPRQARLGKKIALIRSLHHTMSSHNDGSIEVLTGKTPAKADPTSTAVSEHPDFGMVASKVRGLRADALPQYVGIPTQPFMTRPAYLGLAHKAFAAGNPAAPSYAPPNLTLAGGLNAQGLDDRKALLAQFDTLRRDVDVQARMEGTARVRGAALHMLTNPSIGRAFDLGQEPAKLASATAGTSGARVVCWLAGWPRPEPLSSPLMPWPPSRASRSTLAGTITPTPSRAGTWPRACAGGRRSWTRPCRP